jgi:hypothetical protein
VYISPKFGQPSDPGLLGRKLPLAGAFHDEHYGGIPCGFVFPSVAAIARVEWATLLSHEVLEMIVDPDVNLLAGATSSHA